ncbi:MAG: MmgE/PrpD family protein [Pseudomonadota bacterium]
MGPLFLPNWADLRYASAPEPVQRALHRSMLDLAGVAVAGADTQLSKTIRDHAAAHFGGTGSSILCDGRQVSPVGAALAGGMTIDAMDAHDGFKPVKGHIGCGVFPAALALAEAEGLELEAFFDFGSLGI